VLLRTIIDVARAMDIAFRYRNYFRKVSRHRCGLAEAKRLCRISSWIFWYTDDGELLHDRLFSANSGTSRGHNELDLPGITQPIMYEKIAQRKSVPELYEQKLLVCLVSAFFSLFSEHVIWHI